MTVRFGDTLLLSAQAFEDLVSCAEGRPATDELREAGVVRDGVVDPRLVPGLRAVLAPVAVVRAQVRTPARSEVVQAWLRPEASAVLLPRDALAELLVLGADLVPAVLAQAVGLRPRPRPELAPCRVPLAVVDALLDDADTAGLVAALPSTWAGWAAGLSADRWRAVAAVAAWPGEDAGSRALAVLVGPRGLVRVHPDGDDAELRATTSTAVFRDLVRLLPTDPEVEGAVASTASGGARGQAAAAVVVAEG
ncbi:MAG: hypothetical protein JWN17_1191 [Frankiales bacterium]|nr:hypothetical protein [Frankiales bacterium]